MSTVKVARNENVKIILCSLREKWIDLRPHSTPHRNNPRTTVHSLYRRIHFTYRNAWFGFVCYICLSVCLSPRWLQTGTS